MPLIEGKSLFISVYEAYLLFKYLRFWIYANCIYENSINKIRKRIETSIIWVKPLEIPPSDKYLKRLRREKILFLRNSDHECLVFVWPEGVEKAFWNEIKILILQIFDNCNGNLANFTCQRKFVVFMKFCHVELGNSDSFLHSNVK